MRRNTIAVSLSFEGWCKADIVKPHLFSVEVKFESPNLKGRDEIETIRAELSEFCRWGFRSSKNEPLIQSGKQIANAIALHARVQMNLPKTLTVAVRISEKKSVF